MIILPAFLLLLTQILCNKVYISCQKEGNVAFTYDQGPSMYTGKLLGALQRLKVKATFHIAPDYLDNPIMLAYLKKASVDGHLIGLAVKRATDTPESDTLKWIENARNIVKKHINYAPTFLRFPTDSPAPAGLLRQLWAKGMTVTSYNLDSQDYLFVNDTGTEENGAVFQVFRGVFDAIEPPAKGAFIAVQRDLVGPSVAQSELVIKYAMKKGYRAVRLDQCVNGQLQLDKTDPGVGDIVDTMAANSAPGADMQKHLLFVYAAVALLVLLF